MFNTREVAYLICGAVFFIFLLFSKGFSRGMVDVIKAFFYKKFVYAYLVALVYIALCILLLYKAKVWELVFFKDTIMWFIFVALPLMYQAAQIKSFNKLLTEIVHPLIVFEYIFGLCVCGCALTTSDKLIQRMTKRKHITDLLILEKA